MLPEHFKRDKTIKNSYKNMVKQINKQMKKKQP